MCLCLGFDYWDSVVSNESDQSYFFYHQHIIVQSVVKRNERNTTDPYRENPLKQRDRFPIRSQITNIIPQTSKILCLPLHILAFLSNHITTLKRLISNFKAFEPFKIQNPSISWVQGYLLWRKESNSNFVQHTYIGIFLRFQELTVWYVYFFNRFQEVTVVW